MRPFSTCCSRNLVLVRSDIPPAICGRPDPGRRTAQRVSLTGSERAGAAIAEIAGRNLKKVVLELGGSDPFTVLSSDDLDQTVDAAVAGRFENTGQACNAAKRFIVSADIYNDFLTKFTKKVLATAEGLAPLSSVTAAQRLAAQVDRAVTDGAVLVSEGERNGAFFPPGVLTNVATSSPSYKEELFGPVATVYKVDSEDEAVELANDTPFGLGSYVSQPISPRRNESLTRSTQEWFSSMSSERTEWSCRSAASNGQASAANSEALAALRHQAGTAGSDP